MNTSGKTIPKSLHTITVLVAVARELDAVRVDAGIGAKPDGVTLALAVLGYADSPDTYELASKARAILAKSVQS